MGIPNNSPFTDSTVIQSIISKYNEIKENTIFELMQVSGCYSYTDLCKNGYEIRSQQEGTRSTLSLWHGNTHIMTYTIYFDAEDHKIKRDRLVNNLEERDIL